MVTFQLPTVHGLVKTTPVAAEGIGKKKGGKEEREKKKDHWRGGLDIFRDLRCSQCDCVCVVEF